MTAEAPDAGRCFDLRFARGPGGASSRTHLAAQRVAYPAHVCRALYLDDDRPGRCTVLLQSVSGGLFEHDRIDGRIHGGVGAQVRVRSAASTVVHEMTGGHARQTVALQADADAVLEWRPMPLILFPGATIENRTTVTRQPGATVLLADAFLAHDATARGRPFGELRNAVDVLDVDGRLLARERFRILGADWLGEGPAVSGGLRAQGTLWWLSDDDPAALLAAWRAIEPDADEALTGATLLPNRAGALFRVLARDGIGLTRAMDAAVAAARLHASPADAPDSADAHERATPRDLAVMRKPASAPGLDHSLPPSLGHGVAAR